MPDNAPSEEARLIARLARAGAWLEVVGGDLRYHGPAAPTAEVRAELRRLKSELIDWLATPACAQPDADLEALDYAPEPWCVPDNEPCSFVR